MNEVVTFFRHRRNDPGETYRIELGMCRFFIYSRKPIPSRLPESRKSTDRDALQDTSRDLQKAVAKQDGGLILKIIDESNGRIVEVTTIGTKSDAVSEVLVLSPGRPPRFSSSKSGRLPVSSHLIVPVDEDSLAHLHQLIDELAWLPADLEALMINAIRRPSLDARLERIEEKLFGETAEQTANAGWLERMKLRLNRWLTPMTYRVAAATLLALLLGANALLFHQINSKLQASTTSTSENDTSKTTVASTETSTSKPSAELPKQDTLANKARKLFELLRKKRDANPKLQALYGAHFTEMDKKDLTDQEIIALFRQYDGVGGATANRPFLWGIVKLQALEFDPNVKDEILRDGLAYTDMKNVFTKIGLANIQTDPAKQGLLAALACRMGYDTEAPGLKQTTTERFVFVPNGKCDQYTDAHIEKGLDGLIAFVEKMP